ncbi:MAG: methyltransferase domain-containing protein [Gaiellaceae bacterium]
MRTGRFAMLSASPMRSADVGVTEEAPAAAAFDAFAPFYDTLTVHQDYDWWWSALLPLADAAGLSGRRALDVACGTGKSMLPLLDLGWSVAGVDVSAGMLAEAARKVGPSVRLFEHDMRDLPTLGVFDLVCSLNDAVNNVRDAQQLADAFAGFRRNLAPGGVVIFDVNTIGSFRYFAGGVLAHQEPDRILMLEGSGAEDLEPGGLVRLDFVVLDRRELFFWSRTRTSHYQRHHPEADVRRALAAAGLELVEVRGQIDDRLAPTLDELAHEKAVYVARAPA